MAAKHNLKEAFMRGLQSHKQTIQHKDQEKKCLFPSVKKKKVAPQESAINMPHAIYFPGMGSGQTHQKKKKKGTDDWSTVPWFPQFS